jgi:hypothetical protein
LIFADAIFQVGRRLGDGEVVEMPAAQDVQLSFEPLLSFEPYWKPEM